MTNKNTAVTATKTSSPRARVLFSALSASVCFIALSIGFSADAEAASKKHCTNYVSKHARHSCLSSKHARYHSRHSTYTRPQPASFVMDADTGRVLEQENADAPRYPASLTKMMTLYLTFEQLKKGKLSFDTELPVSEHASAQPQTNIALQPGDSLAVKDAVLAIVVRSANDAAVTLGEAIGGSEPGFAQKMTAKARSLGMKNTVFYNASGLPEPRQHTTARDMAILGLALRKDFPQYFPLFKTESFSYHGVTYPTHNHVMMRYDGVDGIKTGYIRASGFNLVTSAKKDNHTLVGVVLGGPTWRERDDKMIAMLDRNFAHMVASKSTTTQVALQRERSPFVAGGATISSAFDNEETAAPEGQGDLSEASEAPAATKVVTLMPIKTEKAVTTRAANDWGIQVGAYARKSDAVKATSNAIKAASKSLGAAKVSIADASKGKYRARLANLTEDDADAACKTLEAKHLSCFTYHE